jgi:hypothetical protein
MTTRGAPTMQIYALTSSHVPDETLDLFLTEEAAEAELREILEDEAGWVNVLRIVLIRRLMRIPPAFQTVGWSTSS